MNQIALSTKSLATGYAQGEPALTDVTFQAKRGEIIALLGPNGGGKTTLLRALTGELPAFTGEISLAGNVAYLPQSSHARLDLPLSVFEVALMGAYERTAWYKRLHKSDKDFAMECLDRVGLSSAAHKQFGVLSGGQRQRALLAKALVQQASILLLDEPFAGVDRESEEHIMDLFLQLRASDHSMLVATHDITQAQQWDQVLCLNHTQIAFGPPKNILRTEVLRQTYRSEIVLLDDGKAAIAVQHHDH